MMTIIDIYKYMILEQCAKGLMVRDSSRIEAKHFDYLERRELIQPVRSFFRGGAWKLTRRGEKAFASVSKQQALRASGP